MDGLEHKLEQDRALRDAARHVVDADVAFLKGDVQERSVQKRAADGVSQTSATLAGRAMDYATANPIPVVGGLVALLLLLFRGQILDLLIDLLTDDAEDAPQRSRDHQDARPSRSTNDTDD